MSDGGLRNTVVTVFLQPWTTSVPFHTCRYDQVPVPLRKHVLQHKRVSLPVFALLDDNNNDAKGEKETLVKGKEEGEEETITRTARKFINTATLVLQLGRMLNVANIDIDPIASALDILFDVSFRQPHRYTYLVLCMILKHLGMDSSKYMSRINLAGSENTDIRLFAVRFIDRLPDAVSDMIGKIVFDEKMLITAHSSHGVSPAALAQTVNPVQFEETDSRFMSFMRRKQFTLDHFQQVPGNNLQTGMTPLCVYTGNSRPLLIVHFEPPERVNHVFTVTDDARIHVVGKLQFIVTLPRCEHDMFVCLLSQRAILELLDVRDVSPIYDNGVSISKFSARMCLTRNGIIPSHPNNILKISTEDDSTVSTTSACTSITLDPSGHTTVEHDVGHIVELSTMSATFRSLSTSAHISIGSSHPNIGVAVTGLVTRVTRTFEPYDSNNDSGNGDTPPQQQQQQQQQLEPLVFIRFDQMKVDSVTHNEPNSVKTVSVRCSDAQDGHPCVFRRNMCTSCAMCQSLLNSFRNEIVFPPGVTERHVLHAILDNDDVLLPTLGTSPLPPPSAAWTQEHDTVKLVRYIMHITDDLPYMSTLFSAEFQAKIEDVRADEYLQMHVNCTTRPYSYLSTGDNRWIQMPSSVTHEVLCSFWRLPTSTIFVGTKRLSAIVQVPHDKHERIAFMRDIVTDGVSSLKRRGDVVLHLYANTRDADIFMFARCQNGNDRVITSQTSRQQHVSFGALFRKETNERISHMQKYRVAPCTSIPELPTVKYGGHVFIGRQLLGEWFMVNDSKVNIHLLAEQ